MRQRLRGRGDFKRLEKYYNDPAGFMRDILGIEPWFRQAEVLDAVATHSRVTVQSGHKVGKSLSAAALAFWFVATRGEGAEVMMTAPTRRQLKGILWKELRRLYPLIRSKLNGPKTAPKDPETGIMLPGNRWIRGMTSSKPEALAGISAPELLFIIDEASGIADELWQAFNGNSAGGATVAAFSNPTRPVGWWYNACHSDDWHNIQISSLETPNFFEGAIEGKPLIKGLAEPGWEAKLRRECGDNYKTHPDYMVRALGLFPEKSANQIVATGSVDTAQGRWLPPTKDSGGTSPLRLGVDPSGFGPDDAVIAAVRGTYAYPFVKLTGDVEASEIAAAVVARLDDLRRPWDGVVCVNVDTVAIGLATAVLLEHHEDHGRTFVVHRINGGKKPDEDRLEYEVNMRTQIWFETAKWMANGELPKGSKLRQELIAQTYEFTADTRRLATEKKAMRRHLKRSPNEADALGLAIHATQPPEYEGYVGQQEHEHEHDDFDELDRYGSAL